MTKIIRKYNKVLLAVLGVFLLVTWLTTGSQGLLQPNPGKQVEFLLGDEKVRARDVSLAGQEFEGLKTLIPSLVGRLGIEDNLHWYLLTREASAQGLVGNAKDGEEWLPELAESLVPIYVQEQVLSEYRDTNPRMYRLLLQNRQFLSMFAQQRMSDPQQVEQLKQAIEAGLKEGRSVAAGRAHLRTEELDLALAKFRAIVRMFNGYTGAARLSDRRLIEAARTRLDRVYASVVSVPASVMVDPALTPPEADLQSHFDAYKSAVPGTGEFGFGYVLPRRVKLEWIKVDVGAVANAIAVDPVEANIHWQKNRAVFTGDFATERPRIESELKSVKVQEVLAEADRAYKARVRSETRKLTADGGVKRVPSDWQPPAMDSLAQSMVEAVQNSHKISMPMPGVERKTDWVRVPQSKDLGGIGEGVLTIGTRELALDELLMNIHEFDPRIDLGFQARVPFESAVMDPIGNRYYLCVTETKGEGPADSLADVLTEVTKDVKTLSAYKALAARVPELQAQAAIEGLDVVGSTLAAEAIDKSRSLSPFHNQEFTSTRSPEIANDDAEGTLRKAIFDQARAVGLLSEATPENMPLRTTSAAIPATLTVVIAQVTGVQTQTVESMRALQPGQTASIIGDELVSAEGKMPFTAQRLKERLGYRVPGETTTK